MWTSLQRYYRFSVLFVLIFCLCLFVILVEFGFSMRIERIFYFLSTVDAFRVIFSFFIIVQVFQLGSPCLKHLRIWLTYITPIVKWWRIFNHIILTNLCTKVVFVIAVYIIKVEFQFIFPLFVFIFSQFLLLSEEMNRMSARGSFRLVKKWEFTSSSPNQLLTHE